MCTVQLPQNVEAVWQSFIMSPRRSARKHSVVLGISYCSVRRILHKDLNFNPCKMVMAQELSNHDMANRSTVAVCLIGILSDVIILMTDVAHCHISGCVNKQNFCTGQRKIQSSSINGLFTVQVWLFGADWSYNPVFLWRWWWACSYSYICLLYWNVTKLPHTRTELFTIWFQQDGAIAYTVRVSIEVVQEMFQQHIISLHVCQISLPVVRGTSKWSVHY